MNKKTWTVIDLIKWGTKYFKDKGFSDPRAEIEWLVQSLFSYSRLDLYMKYDEKVSEKSLAKLNSWIKKRLKNEPLQYITKSSNFYGRDFFVNKDVLIPRPETERLIDISLDIFKNFKTPKILDIGTGSGCIAITLANEIKGSNILAIDKSSAALKVAKRNYNNFNKGNLDFLEVDYFKYENKFFWDMIISNPPYIGLEELNQVMVDVKDFEPHIALTDGKDGVSFYREILKNMKKHLSPKGWLVLEVGREKHSKYVYNMFSDFGYKNIKLHKDYNRDDRVLVVQNN